MTDLEKFVELYRSFGIELTPVDVRNSKSSGWLTLVEMSPRESDKFEGCPGFFSEAIFTTDGEFISQGFWE